MAIYDINSVIEQIKKDLENINSAKEQVESIVSSSTKLQESVKNGTETFRQLSEDVELLLKSIENERQTLLLDFEEKCSVLSGSFEKSTTDTIGLFKNESLSSLNNLKVAISEIKKSAADINSTNLDIKEEMKIAKDSFLSLEKLISKIKTNQDESFKNMCDELMAQSVKVDESNQNFTLLKNELGNVNGKLEEMMVKISDVQTIANKLYNKINEIDAGIVQLVGKNKKMIIVAILIGLINLLILMVK